MPESIQPTSRSTLRPEVPWLWRPYVPRGKLTLLDGDPGFGKSLLTIDLAARLSRGLNFPNGATAPGPGRTFLVSIEDDLTDTIVPRLKAAGADLDQIYTPADSSAGVPPLPDAIPWLEQQVREFRVDLLVLDSLTTLLPAELATGPAAAVRRVLVPLAELARRTGVAVLLVRHLTKRQQARAVCRGAGAAGIAGLARSVLQAGPHPTNPSARALTVLKSNLAAAPDPLGYRLGEQDGAGVVEWIGPATPAALLGDQPARAEAPGVMRATIWLLEALAEGPRPAVELLLAAKAVGLRERTLEKAKKQAGVVSKLSHSKDGRRLWCWCPPGYGDKPYLPPLEFELEPLDDPNEEIFPDELSSEAQALLARDRLAWATRVANGR